MNAQEFESHIRAALYHRTDRTSEMVRKYVRTMLLLSESDAPPYDDLDKFVEHISKLVEEKLDLTMDDATVIQEPFKEWLNARKPDTDLFYWNRYQEYLLNGGFPKGVAGTIDKDTDKIVGLLGNPEIQGEWQRRGLVVGHVQSGKTANYSGVLCKSADYGYRVIILLAGVHNNLRSQTQERVEEAFIGLDTDKKVRTGVGLSSNKERIPVSLTSRVHDFRKDSAEAANFSLNSIKEPVIFVVKKQSSVLNNLVEWFKFLNPTKGGKIRGIPMVLIDDEADNASINTANADDNPTKINGQIRELLALFEQNSYVGYTATPFANVFIDPDTQHDMLKDDLFPRDFIVSLDAPKNYVSASRIFSEEGDLKWMLEPVTDHLDYFPETHKITHQIGALPESLMEAVRRFVLGRAVRILRGQGTDHSSMLVNVSRFNSVQSQVTGLITYYLGELLNSAKLHSALPDAQALKDPGIAALKATWDKMSSPLSETWDQVKAKLADATGAIVVRTINNKSPDKLDYKKHKATGLHVIAVGGLSLSRGFTLEGLMVSYFIRNSIMYDTLLQMGRWFGYRDGYQDVCSLYMTRAAIGWYSHISNAIDELREEFRLMWKQSKTPEDFGFKVRTHPDTLIVTARNKMRTGKKVTHSVTLDGRLVETYCLHSTPDILEHNRKALFDLVQQLHGLSGAESSRMVGGNHLWGDVPAELVTDFLERFRNHDDGGMSTQTRPLVNFILGDADRFGTWDVCLYGLAKDGKSEMQASPFGVYPRKRGASISEGAFNINDTKMRVASRGDEKMGLSEDEIKMIEKDNQGTNVPDLLFRQKRSKPLLMLHVLTLTKMDDSNNAIANDVAAWGISFPGVRRKGRGVEIEYMVNTVWWRNKYPEAVEDYEEDLELASI